MSEYHMAQLTVHGRPAPQGSKSRGANGAMREQSPYLAAWRAAVKKAVYEMYLACGVDVEALPLIVGPVQFSATFRVGTDPADEPDIDKLLRSTFDALTSARLWEDDRRVVRVYSAQAIQAENTGADIVVGRACKCALGSEVWHVTAAHGGLEESRGTVLSGDTVRVFRAS